MSFSASFPRTKNFNSRACSGLRIFKKTAPLLASKAEREVANREMQEEQTGRREKERAEDGDRHRNRDRELCTGVGVGD